MTDAIRAAILIAIDPVDLRESFRPFVRTGCARCGGRRDAVDQRGATRACCQKCLDALKLYRVYGPGAQP
jgi:hypothetical protein